ncbi:lccl domain-containing protein [Stemphylium lycopersici]|nr:lccl domain-containing protein [Stemphylium lycopersici]
MQSSHHGEVDDYVDANDSMGRAADRDEEAHLLREELEFEDAALPPPSRSRTRVQYCVDFLHGPRPPRPQIIQPFFPSIQKGPADWLETRRLNKPVSLVVVLIPWLLIFVWFLSAQLPLRDGDGQDVFNLDCIDTLWKRKNECGIDGIDCRPFSNHSFAFQCPAKCSDVQILNPHAVGPLEVNYRPLVVGTGPYRGDSFLCASAIHAGVVDNQKGGVGRINLLGDYEIFSSTRHHGIESIPFDSYFPLSFSVVSDDSFHSGSDPRSALLPVSLLATIALVVFFASPKICFPIFALIFAHVSFVSDPPSASYHNTTVLPDHISMFAKRLLPAMFVLVVLYTTTIKRTLSDLSAHFEKALFWLGGFWVGALSNYTFDWIPISRLNAHDIEQQPGAKLALAIIILILAVIILGQVYYFWLEGRLLRYLGLYGLFILGILICLVIPGVNLRIHHYILALLLLPGTSLQTRPSLLYQGILLGLFANGTARWDFDSILQTAAALQGDAKLNSVVPQILEPAVEVGTEVLLATFTYGAHPTGVDGISVLVNDVERNRAFEDSDRDKSWKTFEWSRPVGREVNEYFRWAYIQDGLTLDYSEAGTLFGNGSWSMATT